ncbi:MAG TPA: flagellin [Desulfotomaculum sp.]|nr:flagellin [Desulfotomaculum sp.]
MRIYNNVMAYNAHRNLSVTQGNLAKNLEKLSSGLRINRAADDAAGLAISEKMRAQLKGMERAQLNAQDAVSLVQTAEGAFNTVGLILNRLQELATEAATSSLSDTDREKIVDEYSALKVQVNQMASNINFNGIKLLGGEFSAGKPFQIGALSAEKIMISIAKATFTGIVSGGSLVLSTVTGANAAITKVQNAIEKVASHRSKLGAYQNRLEHVITNLGISQENLTAAESRIRDLDVAKEMTTFTRNQILQQTGNAMLAQANMMPMQVLTLMGG